MTKSTKKDVDVIEAEIVDKDTKKDVDVIEAEIVNKDTKKDVDVIEAEIVDEDTKKEKQSTLYYFYSVGCGFCKRAEPIVDELIKNGYDILKLDIAEPDNQKLSKELQAEYNTKCGTPWFVDADNGNQVCGFREKDQLEMWAKGEKVPVPPRPNSPMPKPPFLNAPKKEENKWRKEYKKWTEENKHLPKLQTVDEILARPRPKTDPPRPPKPNMTDQEAKEWSEIYDKWVGENGHLPNLQPANIILDRMRGATQNQPGQPGQPGRPGQPPAMGSNVEARIASLESKLDRLINHLGVK